MFASVNPRVPDSRVLTLPVLLAFALAATAVWPRPAAAQGGLMEELIVTAQKREESIQDVGIAVTALTGEQITAFGFTNSTDIVAFAPGVHASSTSGNNSQQFTIRGSVQNDFGDIAEAPNAVYVDEVYQLASQSHMFAVYDMERVEVLKGPQGTLFGRNATGGLVSFVSKKPTREYETYLDATYGRFDTVRVEGAVSGPISDTLAFRLSGFHNQHDAVLNNTFTPDDLPPTPDFLAAQGRGPLSTNPETAEDFWVQDIVSLRGQLLFEPSEDVEVLVKGSYAYSEPGSEPFQHQASVAFVDDTDNDGAEDNVVNTMLARDVLEPGNPCEQISVNTGNCVNAPTDIDFDGVRPNARGDFFGFFEPDGTDGRDMNSPFATQGQDKVKAYSFTGKLTWDTPLGLVTSVTAYSKNARRRSLKPNVGPAPDNLFVSQSETEWLTQELRIEGETERFRWTAGGFYLTSETRSAQALADMVGGINAFGGLFFNGFLTTADDFIAAAGDATLDTDSYSLFGQVDYFLTDRLTLIVGLRGILEEKDFELTTRLFPTTTDVRLESQLFTNTAPLTLPGTDIPFEFLVDPAFDDSSSDFLWSGKLQLDFAYSDNLLLYAGVNRGIKAGSFNQPLLTNLSRDEIEYDEEVLLSFEGGFKATLFDGRARLNFATYYYDYQDFQAFQFVGTSGAIFNADANYLGGEIELMASPLDNLEVALGFSYIDAEVEDVLVTVNTPRDVEPTFTPDIQFNGMARYRWPVPVLGGSLSVQLDGNHASSSFFNINNFDAHRMDGYWIGNARLRWRSPGERWELGAFVRNFTDTVAQNSGFDLATICGCDEFSRTEPRWWGLNLRFHYN